MWGLIVGILWVLLAICMILLMAVILLQEGKGGGLAEAFGGAGAETFGVKATGINRVTAILGISFVAIVIFINVGMQAQKEATVAEAPPPAAQPGLTGLPEGLELPEGFELPEEE
jgi:preprotein translocase subunit SecG